MKEIFRTVNLTKQYDQHVIVDDLSVIVNEGDIYGFLGLNGAGKSTTIRMLLGMIKPTSGSIHYFGESLTGKNKSIWNKIGYIVETPYSYPNMTVRENLEIQRKLRGIQDENQINVVIEKLWLSAYADTKAKILSLGNAQKLGLAKAMIHNPSILILDEPTNGLDPEGIVEMRKLLKNLAKEYNVTIFISSHILDEMEKLISRFSIINNGCLIEEMNMNEFENRRSQELHISLSGNPKSVAKQFSQWGYSFKEENQGHFVLTDQKNIIQPEIIVKKMADIGMTPASVMMKNESLEEYFIKSIQNNGGN